jgi:predicted nucleic acid-binding protein
MVLLDTNVLSELMRPQPNAQVLSWINAHNATNLFTSAITQAEIELGIALLPASKRKDALMAAALTVFTEDFNNNILAFDQAAASHYAQIVARRTGLGRPIATEDAQIAAIAQSNGLMLATRNQKDFVDIPGLTLINPWQNF